MAQYDFFKRCYLFIFKEREEEREKEKDRSIDWLPLAYPDAVVPGDWLSPDWHPQGWPRQGHSRSLCGGQLSPAAEVRSCWSPVIAGTMTVRVCHCWAACQVSWEEQSGVLWINQHSKYLNRWLSHTTLEYCVLLYHRRCVLPAKCEKCMPDS